MRNTDTIKKILSYIKGYYLCIAASVTLAAVSVVLTLYVPILVGRAIDLIVSKGNVDFDGIAKILTRAVVIVLITGVVNWLMNIFNNKIVYGTVKDIRERTFNHLQSLPLSF